MLRLSEEIAKKHGLQALITGESLGQVASQTVESIACTNAAVDLPIFRPLIGTDKNDTVTIAKHIDTYDISIQPFEDCCTLFVPRHPAIKPSLEKVIAEESRLDSERLLDNALNTIETIKL
ncbi:putative tRNA sulfurtransferase [bioreactor metagenome]|uniref:Putative tRNA sulfurtransferase n=1 Tax=bioreactor metagenome TaxID=1076179 RepID=A0A645JH19_9ZZZZ